MTDYLEMKKVCTRWLPKHVTSLQRTNRVDCCCEELLENLNQDPTEVFGCIVTENEMWIHHYNLLSQQEAKSWKKSDENTPTQP